MLLEITAEARFRCPVSPREICGRRNVTRTVFSPSTSVSLVSIIPRLLHTYLHLLATLTRMTSGRNLGT